MGSKVPKEWGIKVLQELVSKVLNIVGSKVPKEWGIKVPKE